MRIPSRISRSTGSRDATGFGGGSFFRMVPRKSAETTNVTASIAIAIGAVNAWIRNPPSPNALNSATEPVAVNALLAARSRSRGTIVGR